LLQERVDATMEVETALVLVEPVALIVIDDPLIGLVIFRKGGTKLQPMLERNANIGPAIGEQHRALSLSTLYKVTPI